MLASPIAVLFGEFDEMGNLLQSLESDEALRESLNLSNKMDELFEHNTFPHFGGAIFEIKEA